MVSSYDNTPELLWDDNVMCLLQSGVSCVQLNGSMSLNARDAAIRRFTEDPDCKIFLMSLKAGGVALNLTVASHVSNHYFGFFVSIFLYSVCDFEIVNKYALIIYISVQICKRLRLQFTSFTFIGIFIATNVHRSCF